MMIYIVIDADDRVIEVKQVNGPIDRPDHVEMPAGVSYQNVQAELGRYYDADSGSFSDDPPAG